MGLSKGGCTEAFQIPLSDISQGGQSFILLASVASAREEQSWT
jgi:hypothetical protein